MTGKEATQQILAIAAHEEFISADVVARALTVTTRSMLRDWRKRKLPVLKIGQKTLLRTADVVAVYLSAVTQVIPVTPVTPATRATDRVAAALVHATITSSDCR